MNEIPTGRSTPATFSLHAMARGAYHVSIRKDGYETVQDQLVVKTRMRSVIGSILPPILIAELFNDQWKGLYVSKEGAECITEVWLWGNRQPEIEAYLKNQAGMVTTDMVDIHKAHPVISYVLKPLVHGAPNETKQNLIISEVKKFEKPSTPGKSAVISESLKSPTGKTDDIVDRLNKLRETKDAGLLTQEQYEAQRRIIIDKQ